MTINQVSVFLENKPGQLAQVCKVLGDQDVSLVTLSIAETQDFGIARLIVDDHVKAEKVLKAAGFLAQVSPVTAVTVPDRAGGMAQVVSTLSEKGCDIAYSYAFAFHHGEKAVLVFKFKDEVRAASVLASAGFTTLSESQLQEASK